MKESTPRTLFKNISRNANVPSGTSLSNGSKGSDVANASNTKDSIKGFIKSGATSSSSSSSNDKSENTFDKPIFPQQQRHLLPPPPTTMQQKSASNTITNQISSSSSVKSSMKKQSSYPSSSSYKRGWFEFYLILLNIILSTFILLTMGCIAYIIVYEEKISSVHIETIILSVKDAVAVQLDSVDSMFKTYIHRELL